MINRGNRKITNLSAKRLSYKSKSKHNGVFFYKRVEKLEYKYKITFQEGI